MGIYIKYWAKLNNIHGALDNYLSSYALLLMIIHFLQKVVEPKVLPNLQKIPINNDLDNPEYGEEIYEYYFNDKKIKTNAYYEKDVSKIKEYMKKVNQGKVNEETVTNLLVKFFEYYAYFFDSKQNISVHKELIESIKEKDDNIAFSIEDPFEYTHNPGKSMSKDSENYKKFMKAMKKEVNFILGGEYVKRLEREKSIKLSGANNKNMQLM
jgi:DNA polymerase sigma